MDAKKQDQLRSLLTETIVKLCRHEAYFEDELRIEGTICVVSDHTSVVIAQITEVLSADGLVKVDFDLPPQLEAENFPASCDMTQSTSDQNSRMLTGGDNDMSKDCGSVMRQSLTMLSDVDPTASLDDHSSANPIMTDFKRSENGKFRCPHCDKSYGFKHTLRDHINMHLGRRPHVCQHCNASFTHLASMCAHIKRRHGDSIPAELTCELCGEKAMNHQSLKQHYTWRHPAAQFPMLDIKPPIGNGVDNNLSFQLPPMDAESAMPPRSKKAKRAAKLKQENLTLSANVHDSIFSDGADDCQMSNYQMDSMALLESFERQDYNSMMMNNAPNVSLHDDSFNNENVSGDSFESDKNSVALPSDVTEFFEKLTDDAFAYRCRFCGNKFKHRSTLQEHINSHRGVRPYTCTQCGSCFAHHSSLHNHMHNKHSVATSEERQALMRYECFSCLRRFRFPSELERHFKCNPEHAEQKRT